MNAPAEIRVRKAARRRVLMTAILFTPEGAQKVRIRDISAAGAQVVVGSPIGAGSDAILKRVSAFIAAEVTWATGKEVGLKFHRGLKTSELRSFASGAMIA